MYHVSKLRKVRPYESKTEIENISGVVKRVV